MDLEQNGVLHFLDVVVNRDQASTATSVFRKPTHIDRYLHNNSNHQPRQKNTVMRTIVERARRVYSEEQLEKKLDHLRQALQCNGYSENIVNRAIRSKPRPRVKNAGEAKTLGIA
ncbi:hypothetical protein Trydic_g11103 [Trypoxylus dichotomus]